MMFGGNKAYKTSRQVTIRADEGSMVMSDGDTVDRTSRQVTITADEGSRDHSPVNHPSRAAPLGGHIDIMCVKGATSEYIVCKKG